MKTSEGSDRLYRVRNGSRNAASRRLSEAGGGESDIDQLKSMDIAAMSPQDGVRFRSLPSKLPASRTSSRARTGSEHNDVNEGENTQRREEKDEGGEGEGGQEVAEEAVSGAAAEDIWFTSKLTIHTVRQAYT